MSAKEIYAQGGEKACSVCGIVQPINRDHFGSQNAGKSVKARCRQCERDNAKRNHEKNPALLKARLAKSKANRGILVWEGTPQYKQLIREQDNKCGYCGVEMDTPSIDHKTPVSRGGKDNIENLIACCRRCNSNKRDKTEAEYREFLKKVGDF